MSRSLRVQDVKCVSDWQKIPKGTILQIRSVLKLPDSQEGIAAFRCDNTLVANGTPPSILLLESEDRGLLYTADPALQAPALDITDASYFTFTDPAPERYTPRLAPSVGDVAQFNEAPHGATFVAFGYPGGSAIVVAGYICILSDHHKYDVGNAYNLESGDLTRLGTIDIGFWDHTKRNQ